MLPGLVRPYSRGTLRLSSSDPLDPPLIDPAYLREPSDLDRLLVGFELGREIAATRAFAALAEREVHPGPSVTSRSDLVAFIRSNADSYWHHAGSCKMGTDSMAVVDLSLKVRGVEGLRVVDASVMPALPSGNCHAAIIMIAERAADMVKRDAGANAQ